MLTEDEITIIIAISIIVISVVIGKIHKHNWQYDCTDFDQDQLRSFDVYKCNKCNKLKKFKP